MIAVMILCPDLFSSITTFHSQAVYASDEDLYHELTAHCFFKENVCIAC